MDDLSLSGDTVASRGPISGETPTPSDSRLNTVLPKVEWNGETPTLVSNNRDRFEELGVLGVGGMGEVVLANLILGEQPPLIPRAVEGRGPIDFAQ